MALDLDPEEWIRDRLLEHEPLKAMIADRVSPGRLPQRSSEGILDGATYARARTARTQDMDGYSGTTTAVVEIHFWSSDYGRAKQMAAIAVSRLQDHQGIEDGLPIQRTHVLNEFDVEAALEDASDDSLFARVLHVEIVIDEHIEPRE